MFPAAATVFVLLACSLHTVTALRGPESPCSEDDPCGDGWSRIDENRCAKYFEISKTFAEAQEYCRTLEADLVSIHNDIELFKVLCLTWRLDHHMHPVWIGARKSEGKFQWTDGSTFAYQLWDYGQPDNRNGEEDCIESNHGLFGLWSDGKCSKKNFFVCAKKM